MCLVSFSKYFRSVLYLWTMQVPPILENLNFTSGVIFMEVIFPVFVHNNRRRKWGWLIVLVMIWTSKNLYYHFFTGIVLRADNLWKDLQSMPLEECGSAHSFWLYSFSLSNNISVKLWPASSHTKKCEKLFFSTGVIMVGLSSRLEKDCLPIILCVMCFTKKCDNF